MICVCAPLGLYAPNFFPEKAGQDYELTPYLELLQDYRSDFTVISGLSHAGTNPGFAHQATASFLTGMPGAGRPGFQNAISLDQLAAEHIGAQTRFPSLTLSGEGLGLSWTRTGAIVPAASSPSRVFAQMFLDGDTQEVQARLRRLKDGQSILDDVRDQAAGWVKTPKPRVSVEPPTDISNAADLIGRTRLLFDLAHLAFETDSTRLITIMLAGSTYAPPIQGVSLGHHDLSHHGKDPGKLEQLKIVEQETIKTVRDLLGRTMVFFGSNLGDASSHSVKNLPVLLCGGGFRHGQHLHFDPQNSPPLCNLFVSMLQQLGIDIDTFGSSTGSLL
jgi:hypothetical protein